MNKKSPTRSAFIALIGRPNVGKSTLLNAMVGSNVSITSPKPQTTRDRILGIVTEGDTQLIFVDTPGLHRRSETLLNQQMNKIAEHSIDGVDAILFVIEALEWRPQETEILARLARTGLPIYLVVNKVDTVPNKDLLLPFLESVSEKFNFKEIFPISARKEIQVDRLLSVLKQAAPSNPFFFPEENVTDKDRAFQICELIREQVLWVYGQELPHATAVQIEKWEEKNNVIHIHAVLWVERKGQKKILIGEKGAALKKVGMQARKKIELLLNKKVYLALWVKVKEAWRDDAILLQRLGRELE